MGDSVFLRWMPHAATHPMSRSAWGWKPFKGAAEKEGKTSTAASCVGLGRRWEPRGGKSNSFFAKTRDDRFIVKQLSAAERKSFQELAPNFFGYLGRAMRRGQPTCLAKIMGVFTVRLPLLKLPCLRSLLPGGVGMPAAWLQAVAGR